MNEIDWFQNLYNQHEIQEFNNHDAFQNHNNQGEYQENNIQGDNHNQEANNSQYGGTTNQGGNNDNNFIIKHFLNDNKLNQGEQEEKCKIEETNEIIKLNRINELEQSHGKLKLKFSFKHSYNDIVYPMMS